MNSKAGSKRGWIGWSLIAGCVVGVPCGYLLSYLAALPMLLGLFFFLVLGLLVGAVMFRFGRSAAPVPRRTLKVVGAVVTLVIWTTTLVVEYMDFPRDATLKVLRSLPQRLTEEQRSDLFDKTNHHVLSQLLGREYDGGLLDRVAAFPSYLKWVVTDGSMQCPRVYSDTIHTMVRNQRRVTWLIRVVLSLALLGFTTIAQMVSLANVPEASGGATVPPPESEG